MWGIPLAIIVWLISPYLLRLMDPTAAAFDSGILQVAILAQVLMLVFNAATWLGIRFNFPTLFRYYAGLDREGVSSKTDWYKLTPFQRTCVLLCLYLGFLFAFVLLVQIL